MLLSQQHTITTHPGTRAGDILQHAERAGLASACRAGRITAQRAEHTTIDPRIHGADRTTRPDENVLVRLLGWSELGGWVRRLNQPGGPM